MELYSIDDEIKEDVLSLIKENWGSGEMVTKGRVHDIGKLPGFVAMRRDRIEALLTFSIQNKECEIVSLDSLNENRGVGTQLIEKVVEVAKQQGCKRLWLITTNDNTKAMRFYQKRGFNMKAIYINAVEEARKLKPEIPLYGYDDIPILHEIEFERIL